MKRYLMTVKQFCDDRKFITEPMLRWQIFNAATNGLDEHGVIVRMGRRVLIDSDRYDSWIESQQVAA